MMFVSLNVKAGKKSGISTLERCLIITDNHELVDQSLAVLGLSGATIEGVHEASEGRPDLIVIALANPTSMSALSKDYPSLAASAVCVPRVLIPWFPPEELWKLGVLETVTVVLPRGRSGSVPVLSRLRVRHPPALFLYDLEQHLPSIGPLVRGALRLVCLHRPSLADPPCRSVRDVATRVGCSPSYLYGQASKASLDIGAVVRHSLMLQGLWLRGARGRTWADVALLLGFPSSSSWSNFVRRHWHVSPSTAQEAPVHLLISRSVVAAFRGSCDIVTVGADGRSSGDEGIWS